MRISALPADPRPAIEAALRLPPTGGPDDWFDPRSAPALISIRRSCRRGSTGRDRRMLHRLEALVWEGDTLPNSRKPCRRPLSPHFERLKKSRGMKPDNVSRNGLFVVVRTYFCGDLPQNAECGETLITRDGDAAYPRRRRLRGANSSAAPKDGSKERRNHRARCGGSQPRRVVALQILLLRSHAVRRTHPTVPHIWPRGAGGESRPEERDQVATACDFLICDG